MAEEMLPKDQPIFLVTCLTCNGMVFNGFRDQGLEWLAKHYYAYHNDIQLMIENQQFKLEPSPVFCDVCNMLMQPEWMCWDHRVKKPVGLFDTDSVWCVCDLCHPMVMSRNLVGLLKRKVAISEVQTPCMTRPERVKDVELWAQVLNQLFDAVDAGRRVQAGKPRSIK